MARLLGLLAPVALALIATAGEGAGQDKGQPKEFTLVNKAKSIRIIADSDAPILDYFQRHRILVCRLWGVRLKEVMEAKQTLPQFPVSSCSQNDDAERVDTFGARPDVAPPTEAVVKLLTQHTEMQKEPHLALILCQDAKQPGLYHVVGCMDFEPRGFFAKDTKIAEDGFCPKDLTFKGDPKK